MVTEVVDMSEGKKIPKTALKSLMQYCHEQSREMGTSAAEIFRDYLELMRTYVDYFFKETWPEKLEVQYELGEEDYEFIEKGKITRTRLIAFRLRV